MHIEEKNLSSILFSLKPGERVFLRGVPGAGKTTFTQELIRHYLKDDTINIVSPTYTYYQKYGNNLYHFDLYRANTMDDIIRIGADEIFQDPESICLIEWPEIIQDIVPPTKVVDIRIEGEKRFFEIAHVKNE